ncbi:hypothetical protein L1987_10179 [Smallanthus sonchifolius]|uniref:Uncharacterized protein n=1 Tax=Smallanthus sonchifolius TaxID=185202 RepID=A0ACB9JRD9_9ASTR|nr:hypothetical protein L1987_10179 [Smallanthus sonchifolius]
MATAAAAVRAIFRSSSLRSAAARASSQAKSARSSFRIGSQNSLSNRIFRCPVEMSACLESLQPFHTATASALMTSMLTLSQRGYAWLPEDIGYGNFSKVKYLTNRHTSLLDLLSFDLELTMQMCDE